MNNNLYMLVLILLYMAAGTIVGVTVMIAILRMRSRKKIMDNMVCMFQIRAKKGDRYYFCEKKWLIKPMRKVLFLLNPHSVIDAVPIKKEWVIESAEDNNTRYIQMPMCTARDVFRKGKKGWYYAGWYKA